MNTTTNPKMNETFNGMTFAEILAEALNDNVKKMMQEIAMIEAIDEALQKINEDLKQHGDMIMGETEIHECPCERNCGSVKIVVNFIAFKFLPEGIGTTKGTVETILSVTE